MPTKQNNSPRAADASDELDDAALRIATVFCQIAAQTPVTFAQSARDRGNEIEREWRTTIISELPHGWQLLSLKSTGVRPSEGDGTLRGSRLFDVIFEKGSFLIGFEVQISRYEKEDAKGKKMEVGHKPLQEQAQKLWVQQVAAPRPAVAYKVIFDIAGPPVFKKFVQNEGRGDLSQELRSRIRA